jgi:hypothetical protein
MVRLGLGRSAFILSLSLNLGLCLRLRLGLAQNQLRELRVGLGSSAVVRTRCVMRGGFDLLHERRGLQRVIVRDEERGL